MRSEYIPFACLICSSCFHMKRPELNESMVLDGIDNLKRIGERRKMGNDPCKIAET